jgi:hypothetical protein
MDIPIMIEMLPDGFRASSGAPLNLSAEARTQPEAVRQLGALIRAKLQAGAWFDVISVPSAVENPLLRSCGIFDPDDPMTQEWIEAMAENRRKMDEAEGIR